MKKVLLSILAFGVVSSNAIELEMLTGDTRLACEAMLCLASPTQPAECSASLARYFSIDAKKWSQVIAKRRSFLNLCPVDATNDPEMFKYKNDILVNLDGECSVTSLNKRIENKVIRVDKICTNDGDGSGIQCRDVNVYGFRINPQLTNSCRLLSSSKYTDYHLKYTCNNKFYEQEEWQRGYELKEISQEIYNALPVSQREQGEKLTEISRYEFIKLPQNQRKQIGFKYYKINIAYYQKMAIKKECWVNEK
ncbi:hypothetical protein OQE27_001380 [Campylobacter upsaliensis]|uniref:Cpp45 n=1 Tax=Campylobacter upsaliensis TaxID=28080 RepID=A0A5L8ZBJ6_CAMUP|nr:hypothetical protein [Campylobacter upsaliensis]EIO6068925.1 hypothetical protein [Campylobacter upsaliensis]EJA8517404.1 hypothetical protein [Campylobacter upsaliensis]EKC8782956.1 hypothetical protein [Campylobacter upsaliensis]